MNQVTLDGSVEVSQGLRYTPAGIPALQMTLLHRSMQREVGQERQVECLISVLAMGDAAVKMAALLPGQSMRVTGFLCRRSRQSTQLVLHVNEYELL